MLRPRLYLSLMLTTALASAAGCSSDDTEAPSTAANTGDADAADTRLLSDAANPDVRSDTGPDTTPDTGPGADAEPVEKPKIPELAYHRQDFTCGATSCVSGVAVNSIAAIVEKTENGHARHENIDDTQVLFLQDFVLTDQTYQKMLDGWSCGDDTDLDGVKWSFDARILVDGTYERSVRNISGCMAQDSDHPDTTEVRELIDMLDEVRDDHF